MQVQSKLLRLLEELETLKIFTPIIWVAASQLNKTIGVSLFSK